jgi:hypothetical protein
MATKKTATPIDEKFTDQDFDLFKAIDAIDSKNYDWFSRLTDEQKKKFVPYMVCHWTSSVKKSGPVGAYYLMSVDANANKYLFDEHVKDHPELQWLMLCSASPGIGNQKHAWIPHMKPKVIELKDKAVKKDVKEYFSKIYSGLKPDVLEEVSVQYTNTQRHLFKLAEMFPNMKRADLNLMSELISEEDIKDYERESGN